jgi:hypothetical protein
LVPWMMFAGVPFIDTIITRISGKNKRTK